MDKVYDYNTIREYVKENIPKDFFNPVILDIIKPCNEKEELKQGFNIIKNNTSCSKNYYVYKGNNETYKAVAGLGYFFQAILSVQKYNEYKIIPDILTYFFCRSLNTDEFGHISQDIIMPALKILQEYKYGTVHHSAKNILPDTSISPLIYGDLMSRLYKNYSLFYYEPQEQTINQNEISKAIVAYFTSFNEEISMRRYLDEKEEEEYKKIVRKEQSFYDNILKNFI